MLSLTCVCRNGAKCFFYDLQVVLVCKNLKKGESCELPEVLGGLRLEVLVNQATLGNQYPPAREKTQ